MARERDDGRVRMEVRDEARGAARGGGNDDGLRLDGGGHVHRGETHDVVDDAGAMAAGRHLERTVGGEVLLGLVRDRGLHLHGLHRVLAGRRLAREHHGVGAVVDGVRDVRDLGARGARVADHRVEHLRRGDDGLVGRVALGDDGLLHVRHELGRDLDAEVAAGDHDAVRRLEDVIEVLDAERALDLGEDAHVLAAVLVAELADLAHGRAVADEGGRDVVDALLEAEEDVLAVALRDGGQADVHVGNVHALVLADLTGVVHHAVHVLAVDVLHLELDDAVVDQDLGAGLDLMGQVHVIEGDVARGAEEVLRRGRGGDDDLVAGGDGDLLMTLEQARADLGALGVEQDAHRGVELARDAPDALDAPMVLVVRAMGEVEAGDVHPRLDHLAKRLVIIAGGTHRADDLGAFVHADLQLTSRPSLRCRGLL